MTYDGTTPQICDTGLLQYGENIARTLGVGGRVRGAAVAATLLRDIRFLHERHNALSSKYSAGESVPPCAEWLLDNFYLAQREGLSAASALKSCGKLPASGHSAALFSLCTALLRAGDGRVTPERAGLFLQGCQQAYVLSRRELTHFVPILKAAAVAALAALYAADMEGAAESAGRLFSTLRTLSTCDFSEVLERVDRTEQILRRDPAGVYSEMADKTREYYKKRIERLSVAYRVSEHRVAEHILGLARSAEGEARHVGHWLFTRPMGEEKAPRSGAVYISVNILLTLILALCGAFVTGSVPVGLLLLVPLSELVKTVADQLIVAFTPPSHVPRMALTEGVPLEGRTVCVISALLTSESAAAVLTRRLEEYRLASRDCGGQLLFGLLADLPDADAESSPVDEDRLAAVRNAVDELNMKYGGGFFFFSRPRAFNAADGRFSARERKRGAITALARLLCGEESELQCLSGNLLSLRGVRYILTLDEDTRLTPGTARELIGAMLHPLNRPVIDPIKRTVVAGHGLIHPRISVELSSCNRSRFARIFAGHGGTDPYGSDSSELYMDAFESGGFAGKGIIDAHAFTACLNGRIPDNHVLSHDALEGAYLRGAYMGDAELTDKFPADALAYYRRLHRWTRGDWQNLPWLFRRGRGRAFTSIDRFRLYDSLRRSLFMPLVFLSFAAAFFFPSRGLTAAALAALFTLAFRLFTATMRALFRDERETRQHFHSVIVHGVSGSFLQTGFKLIFLPFEAYICLSAAVTALWRMYVSHRDLLRWTPASVFEGRTQGLMKYILAMGFAPLAGLAVFLFAPAVLGKAVGIVWFVSPVFAFSLSKLLIRQPSVSDADRSYLMLCAKRIWHFFEDFCTPMDNFLPPDNWQERPPTGVAHRTSPTNIGLCLLSCIAAIDLGLAAEQSAMGIIQNILTTLRRMPKWNGHLYNWYDTRSLRPLHPAYVSTVDSGNLAACLLILREALKEFGRPELAEECDALLSPMSFRPLYDKSHRLFTIGIDLDKDLVTNSYYDLMASEARTTGYLAIARGEVPRRHWRSLSRAQVEKDGYRGMVSWTGSMFEYLMPRLFFESAEGSLLYESLRFAVGVQKKRGKHLGLPWGVSESAFYALDPCLNYRYKAHGCGALALKRNMNSEYVVSPYSSFLALCCGVRPVVRNLRRLEKLGAWGKYGFWEAVDFTEGRVADKKGETVRCVMAHHIGMSLIAIDNALRGNVMPHRLMRDPAISAHACLLDEKLPLGGVLLRRRETKLPEKPPRTGSIYWEKRGEGADFTSPACCVLSNGDYNVLLTDGGVSRALWGRLTPYYTPKETPAFSHGLALYLKRGETLTPLLPAPEPGGDAKSSWNFSFSGAELNVGRAQLQSRVSFSVSASVNGEKRVVTLSGGEGAGEDCSLVVLFEPVLAEYNDYVNHPAFLKLGLHAALRDGTLVIRRLKRDSVPACCLCLAASAPMALSARRTLVPGRGGLIAALEKRLPSPLGWLRDPMVCATIPLRLSRGTESSVTIALGIGESEDAAYTAANRILAGGEADAADFPGTLAAQLRLTEPQADDAMRLLSTLLFPAPLGGGHPPARNALWRFGVSGNLPILTQEVVSEDDLETAEGLIRQHAFLSLLACPFDLVFLTDEGGDYLRPTATALAELRRTAGLESSHIHILDRSANVEPLLACTVTPLECAYTTEAPSYLMSTNFNAPLQEFPKYVWSENGEFEFYVNHSLPPRAWGNMLTNGRYGFFATDCGTGHMWYKNARENHINRWLCDSVTTHGTETLESGVKSLFAAPDDTDCLVRFGFGYAVWEKALADRRIKTTAFVPPEADARILIIEWEGDQALPVRWSTDLVLCGDDTASPRVSVRFEEGVFTAENPESPFPDAKLRICSSAELTGFTGDRTRWLQGQTDGSLSVGGFIGLTLEGKSPLVLVCGCEEPDKLRELCTPDAARDALKSTTKSWQNTVSSVHIKTPLPALDRLMNGWLPYQALACRLMGRCSIYQSGGAIGFRDQLQDAVNLLLLDTALVKAQIIEAARHQYEQGDVMHWWHTLESETKGVRTRCSDDLIWLPWALCEFTEKTGDLTLCEIPVSWLSSAPLREDERDRYETANITDGTAALLEHAGRALDLTLQRGTGAHGLLKIGNGDWNDGMDKVGAKGEGESVWLTWFFSYTAHRFAALLETLGKAEQAQRYAQAAAVLGDAANAAWDGDWYLRGYFDDGTPLGASAQPCCQIDSIAQSFATLCPEADGARVQAGLTAACARLFDSENRLIRLFEPPFADAHPSPGYIESYGPGFRENGGQYTHGAIWLVMALLRENRADEALPLIEALIPESRDLLNYEAEPFVIAADISSNPDCAGKAGWSWYTGSAGWFFRVITEELLGMRLEDGRLRFSPRLPSGWASCEVTLRDPGGKEQIYTLSAEGATLKTKKDDAESAVKSEKS